MWDPNVEGFPVYRTKTVPLHSRSLQDYDDAVFYSNGQTRFQQGDLGDCWLAAAVENLRQENNRSAFEDVVQINGNNLEFRFWQIGTNQRTVTLASDAVPTIDRNPIFMRSVGGTEYWGILLEKAYAKWVGSYEGLEGGFWTDAIQSFTGGVVERIKILKEDGSVTDNLFDIMQTSLSNGSSLCCIKKEPGERETYHAFCIIAVDEEDDNRSIRVNNPSTQAYVDLSYDDFTQKYYRLDMCHINLDNLSVLQGRKIAQTPWESQQFLLQFNNGRDEFDIILTGTDDDQEDCILVIELIQNIKPDEGELLSDVSPWNAVVHLEMDVNDETFDIKFPQEARCFILNPGSHHIKVSPDEAKHRDIYMRLQSKSSFKVEKN